MHEIYIWFDMYFSHLIQDNMEYRYKYEVEQSHFEEDNKQTMMISCTVTVTCEEGGSFLTTLWAI